MKLSENTVKLLTNYMSINNGICIRATKDSDGTNIQTISPEKNIVSSAKVPELFEKDVYLYDMSLLLSAIKSFNNPEIEFFEDQLIVSDGKSKVRIVYADPTTIIYLDSTPKLAAEVLTFNLSKEDLDQIQKFSGMLSASHIKLENKDGELLLSTYDKDGATNEFTTSLGELESDTGNFLLIMKTETMKFIPGDYTVTIHLKEKKAVAKFTQNDSVQNLNYILPLDASSVWEQ